MSNALNHCSFCHKHKDQVEKLIVSHDVAICNECIDLCNTLLKDTKKSKSVTANSEVPDPREIRDYLDQFVIGQDQAKIVLSVAIANHYKRINKQDRDAEIAKGNILMIGPTGTGKTLMARIVAEYLDVPFVIGDATTLTEAGYVGDDVESLVSRLYTAANNDIERCQRGIIFLDEIDKISRKSESATVSKDVSGEGVQQALLKLIEGTKCKISPQGSKKNSDQTVEIDTTDILFVVGGAFVGLEKIVQTQDQVSSIGFGADLNNQFDLATREISYDNLIKYGLIPEFVGRFTSIVCLHSLDKDQLIKILTQVKHSYIEQYKWLFEQDGVVLDFDNESLEVIADRTLKTKTGARGLHSELERVLLPHMFDLPSYRRANILNVTINKTQVNTPMTLLKKENS